MEHTITGIFPRCTFGKRRSRVSRTPPLVLSMNVVLMRTSTKSGLAYVKLRFRASFGIMGRIAPLFSKMVGFLKETFSNMRATSYSREAVELFIMASDVRPMRAFAADVERPVAEASADRGPDKGVSGLPRTIRGFTC